MNLKFSLLDEDDLKQIETMLVRAGLRIFRQLAREGVFAGQIAQPAAAPSPAPSVRREVPTSGWPVQPSLREVPPEPPAPLPPLPVREEEEEEEAAVEAALRALRPTDEPVWPPPGGETAPPAPLPEVAEEPVWPPPSEPAPPQVPVFLRPPPEGPLPPRVKEPPPKPPVQVKRKHRSAQQVCKTVADRPQGYIQTTEAYEIMGGAAPSGQLSQYVHNREVEAVIVASIKPPTKGLPGRLMINKQSLLDRLKRRDENKTLPVKDRKPGAQVTDSHVDTSV